LEITIKVLKLAEMLTAALIVPSGLSNSIMNVQFILCCCKY
jgi:hypothetical protein